MRVVVDLGSEAALRALADEGRLTPVRASDEALVARLHEEPPKGLEVGASQTYADPPSDESAIFKAMYRRIVRNRWLFANAAINSIGAR